VRDKLVRAYVANPSILYYTASVISAPSYAKRASVVPLKLADIPLTSGDNHLYDFGDGHSLSFGYPRQKCTVGCNSRRLRSSEQLLAL
jgi:hypothetical protein